MEVVAQIHNSVAYFFYNLKIGGKDFERVFLPICESVAQINRF
jgi:hypothetical protein